MERKAQWKETRHGRKGGMESTPGCNRCSETRVWQNSRVCRIARKNDGLGIAPCVDLLEKASKRISQGPSVLSLFAQRHSISACIDARRLAP